ncbi:right-handed parallel beta-helix repeat-containing protein [Brevundimonas sp. 2R-24]|uniref:Right-handed parallel beta-helix repeat-containing protein n=1 Tax=Peiella sedimenti TaxID=3061083 RepID=A0ABT8SMD1_9CAUL|nr:right-handed parallel beta-helix repeat-containing protein [Caulobacteraceae bacterium XZ-24]
MRKSFLPSLLGALGVGAVLLGALALDGGANAQVAAKVESQTRPNFGLLLDPPVRQGRRYRPHYGRGSDWRGHSRPGWWNPHDYRWNGPLEDVAFVDCSQARDPNEVNRAIARLRPGGTLIIRGQGAPCLDSIYIDKPLTIQADGGRPLRDHRGWPEDVNFPVTLRTQPGRRCIEVGPIANGEVVLRNLVIDATQAGDETCIYSDGGHIRLESVVIRYAGDGSAIYMDGGSLTAVEDTRIIADTYYAAIQAEDGWVDLDDVRITNAAIGLQISPNGARDSHLRDVTLLSPPQSPVFGTASAGIVVPGSRTTGRLFIERSRICGYNIGLWIQGPNVVDVERTHICRAAKGVGAYGGQLTISDSAIGASIYGVQIGSTFPVRIENTTIYGAREYDVFAEPGAARPVGGSNHFYSHRNRTCYGEPAPYDSPVWADDRPRRRWGRRDHDGPPRYVMPHWRDDFYQCEDPGPFLGSEYIRAEEEYGWTNPRDFYAMEPWDNYWSQRDNRFYPDGSWYRR